MIEATKAMNDARELDLQDRFINSKCVKYLLRNNQAEEAEKTIGYFTRVSVWELEVTIVCFYYGWRESRNVETTGNSSVLLCVFNL